MTVAEALENIDDVGPEAIQMLHNWGEHTQAKIFESAVVVAAELRRMYVSMHVQPKELLVS
jgi:hypothetical protein